MKVIDVRALLNDNIRVSHSPDKRKAFFRCVCPKHSSGDNEYNALINTVNGSYYSFGRCGTKFQPFRGGVDRTRNLNRKLTLFNFLKDNGYYPEFKLIDEDLITGVTMKYNFVDMMEGCHLGLNSQYLKERNVPENLIRKFRILASHDDQRIVFPLTDYRGKQNGVQVRDNGKAIAKYRIVRDKKTNVSPLHVLSEYDVEKPLYITEGIFGMINMVKRGYQAVSLLGKSGMKNEKYLSQFDKVVGCFDNDEAGKDYAKRLLKLNLNSSICRGAEYDELSGAELENILSHESKDIRGIDEFFNPVVETDLRDYLPDDVLELL